MVSELKADYIYIYLYVCFGDAHLPQIEQFLLFFSHASDSNHPVLDSLILKSHHCLVVKYIGKYKVCTKVRVPLGAFNFYKFLSKTNNVFMIVKE